MRELDLPNLIYRFISMRGENVSNVGILLLVSTLLSMLVAQMIKIFIHKWKHDAWDWRLLFETGGMPSSHSALVTTLAFEMLFFYGWNSPTFVVTVIFAIVVMYDATGVRRQAGEQSLIIHELLLTMEELGLPNACSSAIELRHWKKRGHTPIEVLAGILLGSGFAGLTYFLFR
jgi:acid phosphatase family membrane protein YuiD